MTTETVARLSRVVFEDQHYIVCLIRPGLTVENKRARRGWLLPVDSEQFEEWLSAFDTALDAEESHWLAKALYNNTK